MSELKITPEQVDEIFSTKPGEKADYSFKQGFYAAQSAARIQIALMANWETGAGPRSPKLFEDLAAAVKANWSPDARTLYEAASESFAEEAKAVQPLPKVPVDQSFLHAVIQSLTEAGDASLAETAQHFLDSAPRDGFSTVDEVIEGASQRSWQYAWRAFFPELDFEGKPVPGSFGEEYEWLDFEGFGEAAKAAIIAQEEEDSKPQEDETHRLGYSVWKREHHHPGAWELVGADEVELTDGTVEYGWRSFMPNRDEDDNLLEGLGEEYEWLEAENLEEARSEVARLQAEENEISKARGLAPLSYSVWKRTPERFGHWIPMARIEKEND